MSSMLYTVKETAEIIHCNPSYVYELIKRVYLPEMKWGNYKIRAVTLEEFLQNIEGKT